MQTNPQPQHQANTWSQQQLEDCSLLLLTHLMELQEVQASAVLPALTDKVSRDDHSMQSKDYTKAITGLFFYVSVRVHSVSKLCEMSLNRNFKRSATPTHSNSWSLMPILLQTSTRIAAMSKSLPSPAAAEQSMPQEAATSQLKLWWWIQSVVTAESWMEFRLTDRTSVQVVQIKAIVDSHPVQSHLQLHYFASPQVVGRPWRSCPTWRSCVYQMQQAILIRVPLQREKHR